MSGADLADPAALRGALLAWFDGHGRELPWREGEPDPYRVWVSEVMLQQTRVETVRSRYRAWMERFPTLESLADADPDEVLREWEGLGYYARARNLHRAAREVRGRYGGRVPDDPGAFRALPGVGPYTAGAVLSIAFDRAEPVVDGNVRRVIARWLDRARPPDRLLWSTARRLVEAGGGARPGALNQALMELGSTLCTPRAPACARCPVSAWCRARARGTQEARPARTPRGPLPHRRIGTGVVVDRGAVLLVRRPQAGLLGGMWEFPGTEVGPGEEPEDAVRRGLVEGWGQEVRTVRVGAPVSHVFSHFRATYLPVVCRPLGDRIEEADGITWCRSGELESYPLPVSQRKIAPLAGGERQSRRPPRSG